MKLSYIIFIISNYINKYMLIGILGANGRLGRLICDELVTQNIKYQIIGRDMDFDHMIDCIVDVSSADGTKNL